ncbi:hypothetical protein SPAN111604_11110 [Sphingomonas antarctica]|uniref:hypothetical protein n=1 Tax=Sphingomonas antarctica TaxID=2040274 RepID=UPI0039EC402A
MAKPATTHNAANDTTKPASRAAKGRAAAQTAVDRARDTATDVVERARTAANDAVETAAHAVDNAPLSALAGAIAVGAVAAALIPATAREISALGPLGNRLRGALDDAFAAAKTAGVEQLTTKGITQTALSSGLGTVVGHFVSAAMEASKAASDSVRKNERAVADSAPTAATSPATKRGTKAS